MFPYVESQGKLPVQMDGFVKKDKQVLVPITEEMHERLKLEAGKEGRRMGEMARILLDEALLTRARQTRRDGVTDEHALRAFAEYLKSDAAKELIEKQLADALERRKP